MAPLFKKLVFSAAIAGLALACNGPLAIAQELDFLQEPPMPAVQPEPELLQSAPEPAPKVEPLKKKRRISKPRKSSGKKARSSISPFLSVEEVKHFQRAHGLTPDGIVGPKTRKAMEGGGFLSKEEVKRFQRDHGLTPDGIVGPKTRKAMLAARKKGEKISDGAPLELLKTKDVPVVQEFFRDPNPEVNQDQTPSLHGGSKIVLSRFGHLELTDNGGTAEHRYSVTLNGSPLMTLDGQPSVAAVSKVYDMGVQDAIVLTAFNTQNSAVCSYKNYVLVLSPAGGKMLEINNCTRDYSAQVNNGSLYITFSQREDDRAVGAIWRLEGQTLTHL